MNKLCCVLNTVRTCSGCGQCWCKECKEEYDWDDEGTGDHRAVNANWNSGWRCPVALIVYADNKYFSETFNFVTKPYE